MGLVRLIIVATTVLCVVPHVTARDVDYCYADDDDPYLFFSSATAYHFVHDGKNRYQTIPNCRPMQIWMLARHGTRYPNRQESRAIQELIKVRDEIINNHDSRKNGRLCNGDLDNLKKWRPDYLMNGANYGNLAPQGEEDMKLMARRLQSNFPELLEPENEDISPTNYKFTSANTKRSRDSLFAFMEGLLGSRYAILPDAEMIGNDTLCRASATGRDDSTSGETASDKSSAVFSKVMKFEQRKEYAKLLRDVSQRLGFLYDLTSESLLKMYDACRFEKALNVSAISPWCAVFSKDDLKTIEYREDLLRDSRNRREKEMNRNAECNPLRDMFFHFRNLEKGGYTTREPRGIFYFAESEILYHLYRTMGLNEDSAPLQADNYDSMAKRSWRTSLIDPFASNFVAVFYKCDSSYAPYKVTFYLEEKLVYYGGCDVGLCDWEYLKNKLSQVANNAVAATHIEMQKTLFVIAIASLLVSVFCRVHL